MEVIKSENGQAEPKLEDQKLTREQRRAMERTQEEAQKTHRAFAERFFNFFTNADNPEGEEVQEKIKQLHGQWVTYCKRNNLIAATYPLVKTYCNEILKQYYESKEEETTPPLPSDNGADQVQG